MVVLAIFWLLFFAAALSGIRWTLYLFFSCLAFGSLAILPVNLTGGTTFLPLTACSALLCIRSFIACRRPDKLIDGLLDYNKLGLLTAFIVFALIVTYTAPFIFNGAPIMGLNTGRRSGLAFGSGNITQPLYLLSAFAITISIYQLLLQTDTRRMVYQAIFIGGGMALLAGMIDMATAGSGMLAPLRTATYVIMDGDDVGGMRRVIGFNTEASAYGALVLSFGAIIYFTRIGEALGGIYAKIQTPMALALIAVGLLAGGFYLRHARRHPAPILDPAAADLPRPEAAKRFVESLDAICRDCKVPASLAEVGVAQKDLERMATDAMKQTRLLVNNPREVTYDDAYAIYAEALGEAHPAA